MTQKKARKPKQPVLNKRRMAVKTEESVVEEVEEGVCLLSLNAVWQAPVQVAEGRQQNNCRYHRPTR
jgi:hypothetical protein